MDQCTATEPMDCDETRKVAYVYSPNLVNEINKIDKISGRANLVNSLVHAYGLFKQLDVIKPSIANEHHLKMYHSSDFIDFLKKFTANVDEEKMLRNYTADDYGIGYDCPLIENMYNFCCSIAGASLTAAQLLITYNYKYVINWFGGWHHAKKDKASGFCYTNDIVLCILRLREKYDRVLYIDFDLHHGDGVQDAFELTDNVMCLSLHKFVHGFYPGSGSIDEIGKHNGKYYTVNVPFKSGINDKMYFETFKRVFNEIQCVFKPQVIVCQCGADGLYGDPIDAHAPFNLTAQGYLNCIDQIIETQLPTIFLGGGGYNLTNTSRLWCSITARLLDVQLAADIPEHDLFLEYGPDYEIDTVCGYAVKNQNTPEYLNEIVNKIFDNLSKINVDQNKSHIKKYRLDNGKKLKFGL